MPSVRKVDWPRFYPSSYTLSSPHCHVLVLFTASSLFSQAATSSLPDVAHYNGLSSFNLYNDQKTFSVRVAAAACAAISMMSSFIAFYWFCRMEKRFRHRLIMLLILGDLMKALWLFLLAAVSIARGTIVTESAFCQASGFFVQFGTETSDFAVLCIAVHSALQVFRPSNTIRSDGLYPYRIQIYVGALLIPTAMAGLAFMNPRWGYVSQGPFCSLPLRPFWYRLALQWIPRYVIAVIILGLAIAIYAHVGFEFRALSSSMKATQPSISTITPILSSANLETRSTSVSDLAAYQVNQFHRDASVVSVIDASRRVSAVASVGSHSVLESPCAADRCYTLPGSQTYDTADTTKPDKEKKAATQDRSREGSDGTASPFSNAPSQYIQRRLAQKRIRIYRQLRLMFVYPLAYILVWLFPFINQCMSYKDNFVEQPVYWLSLVNVICLTLMGTVDCLIFSLRERPWRHIPSSDGSFTGSFMWWRTFSAEANGALVPPHLRPSETLHRVLTEVNPDTPNMQQDMQQEGWRGGVIRAGRSMAARNSGSSSDHAKFQAAMARTRLELEKEDRRVATRTTGDGDEAARAARRRRSTGMAGLGPIESPADERSEYVTRDEGDAEATAGDQVHGGGQSESSSSSSNSSSSNSRSSSSGVVVEER